MKESLKKLRQHLLTGVSYAIPFIACGGIMIAVAITMVSPIGPKGPNFSDAPRMKLLLDIGTTAFALMLPVLASHTSVEAERDAAVAVELAIYGDLFPKLGTVIPAQKANTANAFSLPQLALSTANVYSAVQPGGSLYGLQQNNPVSRDDGFRWLSCILGLWDGVSGGATRAM